jgi:hypothetical protein
LGESQADAADSDAGTGHTGDTTDASTDDGAVGIAAGIAINISDVTAEAAILADMTDLGTLTVHSGANADVISKADGSAVDPENVDVGVGVAVAINLVDLRNTAYIDTGVTMNTHALTINADMASRTGESTPYTHIFNAEAISGAGSPDGDVGVAGSFAMNMVDDRTEALIKGTAAVNANNYAVTVGAGTASTPGNRTATTAKATSSAAGNVGIGASVALNILDTNNTYAMIEDGAVLTNAAALSVTAYGDHTITTTTEAGSAGGSVAISPSVAIAIADNNTTARIGTSGTVLNAASVNVSAAHKSAVTTLSDGSAAGDVGVGVSIAINDVNDIVTAEAARTIWASGVVTITASSLASASATAKAVSKGAPEGSDDANTEAEQQLDHGRSRTDEGEGSGDDAPDATASDGSGGSSDVGIAAALALNMTDSKTHARLLGDVYGTTGAGSSAGKLTVTSANDTDANAVADSSTVEDGRKEFDAPGDIDSGANTITLGPEHGFSTGDAVVYNKDSGAVIGGLSDGETYYIILVDDETDDKVKLASSEENATAGTAIDLDGTEATGTQRLTPGSGSGAGVGVAVAAAVNATDLVNEAYIQTGRTVRATGVDVKATMKSDSGLILTPMGHTRYTQRQPPGQAPRTVTWV